MDDEGFSWVPLFKNAMSRVPGGFGWAASFVVSALAIWRVPELAKQFGLLLAAFTVGIGLLWRMENWTAARDREAIAVGMATGGWGTNRRWEEDREVRRRTAAAKATASATSSHGHGHDHGHEAVHESSDAHGDGCCGHDHAHGATHEHGHSD